MVGWVINRVEHPGIGAGTVINLSFGVLNKYLRECFIYVYIVSSVPRYHREYTEKKEQKTRRKWQRTLKDLLIAVVLVSPMKICKFHTFLCAISAPHCHQWQRKAKHISAS